MFSSSYEYPFRRFDESSSDPPRRLDSPLSYYRPVFDYSRPHPRQPIHPSLPSYTWQRPVEPALVSFRDASLHSLPAHRSTALTLFEWLHPELYRHSHALRSLVADYAARLSNYRLPANSPSPADFELQVRHQAFDTLWRHPQHGEQFRAVWAELALLSQAVHRAEWEATVERLYRKVKKRMGAEERRAADAERARQAQTEAFDQLSWRYTAPRLGLLQPEAERQDEKAKEQKD